MGGVGGRGLGQWMGAGGDNWISQMGNSTMFTYSRGLEPATDGDLRFNSSLNSSPYKVLVNRMTADGSYTWAEAYVDGTANSDFALALAVDGTACYMGGQRLGKEGFLSKFDSSGSRTFTVRLYSTLSTTQAQVNGVAVDSSGNVYAVGHYYSLVSAVSRQVGFVAKFSSSGSLTWAKRLHIAYGTVPVTTVSGITTDGTDCYIVGGMSAGTQRIFAAKVTSSGSLSWITGINSSTSGRSLSSAQVSLNGSNLYIGGWANSSTAYSSIIMQVSTSGAVNWQKKIDSTSGTQVDGVYATSDGAWFTGSVYGTSNTGRLIRTDSSGSLSWMTQLARTSTSIGLRSVTHSGGDVFATVDPDAILRVKDDGSGTGTGSIDIPSTTISYTYDTASETLATGWADQSYDATSSTTFDDATTHNFLTATVSLTQSSQSPTSTTVTF